MRFVEFKNVNVEATTLVEAARIQHAEDFVFWDGSKGANRVLQSLINLEKGGHKDVTVKWDGSPAVIFGRDENGEFIFTDKSGFVKKGGVAQSKSPKELEKELLSRSGGKFADDPDRQAFASKMGRAFTVFEAATPKDHRGFFKGDLLYYTTPPVEDGYFKFKPQLVEYSVKQDSELGKRIAQSEAGIVIHREVDAEGGEGPLTFNAFEGNDLLVFPSVTAAAGPKLDTDGIAQLKAIISKDAAAMDSLLDPNKLTELKLKKLPDVFYAYMNSKVDTGLDNLGADFLDWVENRNQLSGAAKKKIATYVTDNKNGFNALWEVVGTMMRVKDDIINQLDKQDIPVKQSINGQPGGEGYVLAHPEGDIKLVPRATFTAANRAVQR